jgi:hypothetical protein
MYGLKKYSDARENFARAYELSGDIQFLYYIAACEFMSIDIGSAKETLAVFFMRAPRTHRLMKDAGELLGNINDMACSMPAPTFLPHDGSPKTICYREIEHISACDLGGVPGLYKVSEESLKIFSDRAQEYRKLSDDLCDEFYDPYTKTTTPNPLKKN